MHAQTVYWAYVARCEADETTSCPWLTECVRELFGLDAFLAYQHAFVYVRDMALAVHSTLSVNNNVCDPDKRTSSHSTCSHRCCFRTAQDGKVGLFVNWSFVSQLRLWAYLIGLHNGAADTKEPSLSALAYPLIQLASNAARYGLRGRCHRCLNTLHPSITQTRPAPWRAAWRWVGGTSLRGCTVRGPWYSSPKHKKSMLPQPPSSSRCARHTYMQS